MVRLELYYQTPRGAGVVRYLRDVLATEKALRGLAKRHIEADLYVSGERDGNGNRAARVGGVDHGCVQWQWWFDPAVFAVGSREVRA